MTCLTKKSPGVFISDSISSFCLNSEHIDLLKKEIPSSPKKRSRICIHKSDKELIHQMIIAMPRNHYVQPHKHTQKSETYQVIEGEALFVQFNERGSIDQINPLNPKNYFFKPSEYKYHTLIVLSDFFVFTETTNGPFEPNTNIPAPWAPSENEDEKIAKYQQRLTNHISAFQK